jgi:hypothetical protein
MAGPVNIEYFDGLKRSIEGCASCEQLQEVTAETFATVTATMESMTAQLAALQPLLALLEPPSANPAQIVTWLTDFINLYLTPQVRPVLTIPVQLAAITAQMAELPALIEAKMAQFPSCSVPIPVLPPVPTP